MVSAAITTWLPHNIITNSPLANPFIAMPLMLRWQRRKYRKPAIKQIDIT